jgi:SAM-dependent methyltransferase
MSLTTESGYLLDHSWADERRRLELLEDLHDPASARRLESTGVGPGWRCLEVGAGRGSVARWLGERVGPTGSVVAIDLEIDLLEDIDEPNIEVRRADVLEMDLPAGSIDLIHTRAVLSHIPERARAIERMISWLAPGGWLVLEELDWIASTAAHSSWDAMLSAYDRALPTIDWGCARGLVTELPTAGLHEIRADSEIDAIRGGAPLAEWYALSMLALRDVVIAAGTATEGQIDAQLARLADPAFHGLGFGWTAVCGRRPS